MPKRGKQWKAARKAIDSMTKYPLADAVKLVKEHSYSKFV
jgi:ribosomal protein L1